jgi:hypothetical protein
LTSRQTGCDLDGWHHAVCGTPPTSNQANPPLRLVAGPVSDASFPHPPLDGTMAVDTVDNRLYVRVGGAWRWSALNA